MRKFAKTIEGEQEDNAVWTATFFPVLTESDYKLPFYNERRPIETPNGGERPHGFADFQWLQCTAGRDRLALENGEKHEVRPGQGMWLYRGNGTPTNRFKNRGRSNG